MAELFPIFQTTEKVTVSYIANIVNVNGVQRLHKDNIGRLTRTFAGYDPPCTSKHRYAFKAFMTVHEEKIHAAVGKGQWDVLTSEQRRDSLVKAFANTGLINKRQMTSNRHNKKNNKKNNKKRQKMRQQKVRDDIESFVVKGDTTDESLSDSQLCDVLKGIGDNNRDIFEAKEGEVMMYLGQSGQENVRNEAYGWAGTRGNQT